MNRQSFINKDQTAQLTSKAERELYSLKMAWGDFIYLEVAERKANEGSAKIHEFELKMEKLISKMKDFAVIPAGEMDDLDFTFEFDKTFDTVTFWIFRIPDDGLTQYKIKLNISDVLSLKTRAIHRAIREQVAD